LPLRGSGLDNDEALVSVAITEDRREGRGACGATKRSSPTARRQPCLLDIARNRVTVARDRKTSRRLRDVAEASVPLPGPGAPGGPCRPNVRSLAQHLRECVE
jgi:hypothetical protein